MVMYNVQFQVDEASRYLEKAEQVLLISETKASGCNCQRSLSSWFDGSKVPHSHVWQEHSFGRRNHHGSAWLSRNCKALFNASHSTMPGATGFTRLFNSSTFDGALHKAAS